MNRRQLLTVLAAVAIAPGELWVPQRTIFLPPTGGWPEGSWDFRNIVGPQLTAEQFYAEFTDTVARVFQVPAYMLRGEPRP